MARIFFNTQKSSLDHGKGHAYRHFLAIALAISLILLASAPVLAAVNSGTTKQEVVYVDLEQDGKVRSVTVVNIFDVDDNGMIIDYGDYTALRNMTTTDGIEFENETVRIDTNAQKLYYEGSLKTCSIPWKFSILYSLDGVEYPADELAGRSGELRIDMSIRENPECESSFFEHYGLQAAFTFDTTLCENIVSEGAVTANVGSGKSLSYIILPGIETDITITADVTDFRMDGISINGLPLGLDIDTDVLESGELDSEFTTIESATEELANGAEELSQGMENASNASSELAGGASGLANGVSGLAIGAEALAGGTSSLLSGVSAVDEGASDLLDGAVAADSGSSNVKSGAEELSSGIEKASDGAAQLHDSSILLAEGIECAKDGAYELFAGLNNLSGKNSLMTGSAYSCFVQLADRYEATLSEFSVSAGLSPVDLTPENYKAIVTELAGSLSGGICEKNDIDSALTILKNIEARYFADISNAIRNDPSAISDIETYIEATYGNEISADARESVIYEYVRTVSPIDPSGYIESEDGQAAVAAYLSSQEGVEALGSERNAIKARYIDTSIQQQATLRMDSSSVQSAILAEFINSLSVIEKQSEISSAIGSSAGTDRAYPVIIQLAGSLDSFGELCYGLSGYTSGVESAANGAYDLFSGLSALQSGAEELEGGAKALSVSLDALSLGSKELLYGTIALNDGTTTLVNGAASLKSGSIELLNGVIDLNGGAIDLMNGAIKLRDGSIELLNGAIELHDGTVRIYDGTIELKDGTMEFRDKTSDIKASFTSRLKDAIGEVFGGEFDVVSFVSSRNTNVESVQFVMKTDEIRCEDSEAVESSEDAAPTFWQKLLSLFGL